MLERRALLGERDRQILEYVAALRLLCAHQIQQLLFPDDAYSSPATASRCCRRVLERLTRERLLVRLERRVGGVRAGSASFVYALTTRGQRVIDGPGARRRLGEPSARFLDHTPAVADLLVQLVTQARRLGWELLDWQSEPKSWRTVLTLGGRLSLRPDLFVILAVRGYELRWFVEVDRGNEHLPAIRRKCRLYQTYYRSGEEQRAHEVFPRVLWVVPDASRVTHLSGAIQADQRLTSDLFRVAVSDQALVVIGETP